LTTTLLQIYSQVCHEKNFQNRSIFDELRTYEITKLYIAASGIQYFKHEHKTLPKTLVGNGLTNHTLSMQTEIIIKLFFIKLYVTLNYMLHYNINNYKLTTINYMLHLVQS